MIIYCRKCGHPFKNDDEVQGTMKAYWHVLASRVHFSITKPHDVEQDSLEHVKDCILEQSR